MLLFNIMFYLNTIQELKYEKKIKIICTLGPSSLNANFLEYSQKNIDF